MPFFATLTKGCCRYESFLPPVPPAPHSCSCLYDTLQLKLTTGDRSHRFNCDYKGACTVYAALYDQNGRMLSCKTASRAEGTNFIDLTLSTAAPEAGYSVKVFLLDGNHRPLTKALS